MNTFTSKLRSAAAAIGTTIALTLAGTCVHAAGFQRGFAADPDGKPLEIGIWYPSEATTQPVTMGPTTMSVAVDGPVQGKTLPLVVMSHGNGGSFLGHYDTAIALADAGFVVAAVTHTGDNYADQSRSTDVMDRPRHMSRVIDHMLSTWDGRATIDAARIGMFGFSSGGFTTLVSIGGLPDFSTIGPMCRQYPGDFACQLIAKSGGNVTAPPTSATARAADPRIKAAVVAAPALGFAFSPDGLTNVKVPVQLWRAENDLILPHPRYAEAVRLALPDARQMLDYRVVPNAGHYDFLVQCSSALASIAPAICSSAAGFDRAAFHASFNTAVVGFFSRTIGVGSSS
ncbi:putative dienelactone hydrolase [Variovorax sp. GrIS 2.14]|uniref:alpha/beta hydrolase family protein n=1 Tax=Variovorax sp. GrIS 2.14 TaxID=3071709 RepID=UPI0038F7A31B